MHNGDPSDSIPSSTHSTFACVFEIKTRCGFSFLKVDDCTLRVQNVLPGNKEVVQQFTVTALKNVIRLLVTHGEAGSCQQLPEGSTFTSYPLLHKEYKSHQARCLPCISCRSAKKGSFKSISSGTNSKKRSKSHKTTQLHCCLHKANDNASPEQNSTIQIAQSILVHFSGHPLRQDTRKQIIVVT